MKRTRALVAPIVCLLLCASASTASASPTFHPHVKNALGLVPPVNKEGVFGYQFDPLASGQLTPVTYHGGQVMTSGVTLHAIFWDGNGAEPFAGSPGAGIPDYKGMIEQFFTDVAAGSTGTSGQTCTTAHCNDFTVEPQFGQEGAGTPPSVTLGENSISFNAANANDVIVPTDPYPSKADQCASPSNAAVCVTDAQVQHEVDTIASSHGNARGLHNIWYVFLPPNVDECITAGVCGTNAFGGYHSLSNLGHGVTIYAIGIDTIIENGGVFQGIDPQGNPDAEVTADIADHEVNEAISDPTGVGWLDPNGFEIGDKCEFGPQRGTVLGHAANGSPFNQVINGHQYFTQTMWANNDGTGNPDCVQSTTVATPQLPLPQVNMIQFSPNVSGNIGSATPDVPVEVTLLRGGAPVADQSTTTAANGNWSLTLQHPVGDDRDVIVVAYDHGSAGAGVPSQPNQVILTGNGGNPFTESGWMGWSDMDNGSNVAAHTLTLGPCFQTGLEAASVVTGSPTDFCNTQTDAAPAPTNTTLTSATPVNWSSNDNRAFQPPDAGLPNGLGGLVNLTVNGGEPNSTSAQGAFLPFFTPTGFPTCTADLGAQLVTCSGLTDGNTYSLNDGSQHASGLTSSGGFVSAPLRLLRGDTVSLSNGLRTLTTLHVANLQVHINGESGSVSSGTCTADQYWGGPLTGPVLSFAAGELGFGGPAGTGQVCNGGDATGLPTASLAQTDDQSGGQTVTEVADVLDTSPIQGETLYGKFTALAEATDGSSPIAVQISRGASTVFSSSNVNTANGVAVPALSPGNYAATWTVTNPNGDTRTVTTRFIEQSSLQGPPGPQGPQGPQGPPGPKPKVTCTLLKHHQIECTVTFPKQDNGNVRVRIARGGRVVALGHGKVAHGRAKLIMRELRTRGRGAWKITVVFTQTVHKTASTNTVPVRVR